jgi:hypothetical protein
MNVGKKEKRERGRERKFVPSFYTIDDRSL